MTTQELYSLFLQHRDITTDSRKCNTGSIFFALKGDNFNGNTFAKKALEQGCAYVVIDEKEHCPAGDNRYILVENVLETLTNLARLHRKTLGAKVVGITGTNGKTTTKELISAVLSTQYNILYTLGNLNNHIGVPLTLLRLNEEHELAVVEMGANHIGEIDYLCNISDPDLGLITNIGKAHLEGFGNIEGVIKTKGELYRYIEQNQKEGIFINGDDEILCKISNNITRFSYGTKAEYDVCGSVARKDALLSVEWKAKNEEQTHTVNTKLIGQYNLTNVLAAISVGLYFNITPDNINHALETYTPSNNRSQLLKTERNMLIVDAYNANPTSMKAAIENFKSIVADNKMLILGGMKELGADSVKEHQNIIDLLTELNLTDVWLVGKEFMQIDNHFYCAENVECVIEKIKNEKLSNKTILIKGSNSIRLNSIIEFL